MKNQRNRRHAADTVDVSLERGQVATLVVGSVLALGAVFLLGVGMGKRLSAQPAAHPQAAVAAAAPTAKTAAAPAQAPKVPALTFHDALTEQRVDDGGPAHAAHGAKGHAAPAHHAKAHHAKVAAKAPAKTPAHAAKVAAKVADAAPAHPAGAKAPSQAASGDTAFSIQVASSRDEGDTRRLAKKLVAAGYDARVVPADIPGRGRWYRVRVGHFPSRESASLKQAEIKVAVNLSGIVVPD